MAKKTGTRTGAGAGIKLRRRGGDSKALSLLQSDCQTLGNLDLGQAKYVAWIRVGNASTSGPSTLYEYRINHNGSPPNYLNGGCNWPQDAQGMLDTGHVSVELDVAACGGSSYGNRLVSTAGSPNPVSITGPNFSQIDAIAVHAQVQAYPGDSAPGNLIMKWSALEVTFMDCTGNSDPKTMIDCVPITAELIPNPKQVVTGSATIVVVFRPTPPFVANRVVVGGTAKLQSLDPQHPFPNHPNGNLLPTQIMGRIFVWTS